jgi:hypothetical protein
VNATGKLSTQTFVLSQAYANVNAMVKLPQKHLLYANVNATAELLWIIHEMK